MFGGASSKEAATHLFPKNQIIVGRLDTSRPGDDLDLNLPDARVARRHARVSREGEQLFIEDLDSERGTLMGGFELRGQGKIKLVSASPIITGQSTWTVVPSEWLCVVHGRAMVYGPFVGGPICYALHHCGWPIIGELRATNYGAKSSDALELRLQIVGYTDTEVIKIDAIDPMSTIRLGQPKLSLDSGKLATQVVPASAVLRAELGAATRTVYERGVTVLGFWDWPFDASALPTIAAFVLPHNPTVERIVLDAQADLGKIAGVGSFRELLRADRDDNELLALRALYSQLKDGCSIFYEAPNVRSVPHETRTYQSIRLPHRIFRSAASSTGHGTCLDLALLLSACLENIGLCPLVIFSSDSSGTLHVLAGCWLGTTPGGRPVVSGAEEIRDKVASGRLLVIEATGCAAGASAGLGKLSFDEATESAVSQLRDATDLHSVDVAALRPPNGSITPIESPLEPEVRRAYIEAKEFARRKRREVIETTHLLYAVFKVNGSMTKRLLEAADSKVEDLIEDLDKHVRCLSSSGEPRQTRNLRICQEIACETARQRGADSVQEQDLLWALFRSDRQSSTFLRICGKLGLDLELLRATLRGICPELERSEPVSLDSTRS